MQTPAAKGYVASIQKAYPSLVAGASSVFTYNYYNAAWALSAALKGLKGDVGTNQSKLQKALSTTKLPQAGYGPIKLDSNRNAIAPNFVQQLQTDSAGKLIVQERACLPRSRPVVRRHVHAVDAAAGPQVPDVQEEVTPVGGQGQWSSPRSRSNGGQ